MVHPGELINITSPAYPKYYPPSVVCQWRVRTSDQSNLTLHLMWIDIQNTTGCNSAYLQFKSTNVDRICGTSGASRAIVFSRESTYLKFVSDEKIAGRGFLLQAFLFPTTGIRWFYLRQSSDIIYIYLCISLSRIKLMQFL